MRVGAQLSPAVRLQAQNPVGSRGQTRSISSSCRPQPPVTCTCSGGTGGSACCSSTGSSSGTAPGCGRTRRRAGHTRSPDLQGFSEPEVSSSSHFIVFEGGKPLFNAPTYCRWGCRRASCSGSTASWRRSRGAGGCRSRCRAAGSTCAGFFGFWWCFFSSLLPLVPRFAAEGARGMAKFWAE